MYLSVLAALLGEGLLFRSSLILAWAATVAVAFHLFVVAYEEPTLRRRFGSDDDAYCRAACRGGGRAPPGQEPLLIEGRN